jgi:hypothetical protein
MIFIFVKSMRNRQWTRSSLTEGNSSNRDLDQTHHQANSPPSIVASRQQPIDNRLNNRIENTRTRLSNRSDGRDRRPTRTITKKEPRTGITGNIDRRIRIKEILLTIHGPTETMTVRSSIEVMSKIRYVPTSDFSFVLIKATDDKTLSRHRMHFVSFNSCNEFPTLTANAWLH